MAEPCKHTFGDTQPVFTGTPSIRACLKCSRIEVMLTPTGKWVVIEEYVQRRIGNGGAR